MKRKMSVSAKVRRMVDQGHTNKDIIEKLGVKPQAVYNIRYQINKARGLGALGTAAPSPAGGIGAPPKRKYTRRVKAGTGITAPAPEPQTAQNFWHDAPVKREGEPVYMPIAMIEPPTLWQRVKGWFRGSYA